MHVAHARGELLTLGLPLIVPMMAIVFEHGAAPCGVCGRVLRAAVFERCNVVPRERAGGAEVASVGVECAAAALAWCGDHAVVVVGEDALRGAVGVGE